MQMPTVSNANALTPAAAVSTPAAPGNAPAGEVPPFAKLLNAQRAGVQDDHARPTLPGRIDTTVADATDPAAVAAAGDAANVAAVAETSDPVLPVAVTAPGLVQRGMPAAVARIVAADKDGTDKASVVSDDATPLPEGLAPRAKDEPQDATVAQPVPSELVAAFTRPAPGAPTPVAAPKGTSAEATTTIATVSLPGVDSKAAAPKTDAPAPDAAPQPQGSPEARGASPFESAKEAQRAADPAVVPTADATARAVLDAIKPPIDKDRADPRALDATPATPAVHAAGSTAALHAAARLDVAPAAAPVAATIATPVTAPEFREALGVQVSVMARDGVHRAELHLNPGEMGPISVQIAIDGRQAQVDFGVDSSATRQIIESGLPELAAALRDAGFTLSGGGVSQHSRGRQDGGETPARQGTGGRRIDAGGESASGIRRVQVRLPQGAVDLYA